MASPKRQGVLDSRDTRIVLLMGIDHPVQGKGGPGEIRVANEATEGSRQRVDREPVERRHQGFKRRVNHTLFAPDVEALEAFRTLTAPGTGIIARHSAKPVKGTVTTADGTETEDVVDFEAMPPAWFASNDQGLATLLAAVYPDAEVRELDHETAAKLIRGEPVHKDDETTGGGTTRSPGAQRLLGGMLGSFLLGLWLVASALRFGLYLRTNAGADFQAAQMGGAGGTATAQFIALSTSAGPANASHTTLAGEITTTGLTRASGSYSHTNGTSSYTVSKTFTAVAADVTTPPVNVTMIGNFTAVSVGILVFEAVITTATFNAAGDNVTITITVNL